MMRLLKIMSRSLKKQVFDQIHQVHDQVCHKVLYKVRLQVHNQGSFEVRDKVWRKVRLRIWDQLCANVLNKVKKS